MPESLPALALPESSLDQTGTRPRVYVDELLVRGQWRYGASCHLLPEGPDAQSLAALHAFAKRLGMRASWFQNKRWPHYDLTGSKRAAAIAMGAVSISTRAWMGPRRHLFLASTQAAGVLQ